MLLKCAYILLFTVISIVQSEINHICSHSSPLPAEIVHSVLLEPLHVMKRRSIKQDLRIRLHFHDSIDALSTAQQNMIKYELLADAVTFWQQALKVRDSVAAIKLQRKCVDNSVVFNPNGSSHGYCADGCAAVTKCGDITVPPDHLDVCRSYSSTAGFQHTGTSGIGVADADYILYVSAHDTHRCDVGTTVAYAAYCQLEMAFDRPVAGYVNLCPHAISVQSHDLDQMHATVRHEILHALGFSAGLFAFFRDETGEPLTERLGTTNMPPYNSTLQMYQWSEKTIKTITRSQWKVRSNMTTRTVHMMVTPKVREEARRHFDCLDLEGAELEDQDFPGTAFSHFEKRVFENEAMTGGYTQNPVISRLSLALMEDTGWYRANYSMAQPLKWGAGLGCDFVKKSCADWMRTRLSQKQSPHPFCTRIKQPVGLHTECTDDYSASAVCNLKRHDVTLPFQYQYFDDLPDVDPEDLGHYGGSVALADYCPYIQEFNWKYDGDTVRTSSCTEHVHIPLDSNYLLEQPNVASRCFEHKQPWTVQHCDVTHTVSDWGSGCYQMRCDADSGLIVIVNAIEYQCVNEGDIVVISQSTSDWHHRGSIVCPSCDRYCKTQFPDGCPSPVKQIQYFHEANITQVPCTYVNSASRPFASLRVQLMTSSNLYYVVLSVILLVFVEMNLVFDVVASVMERHHFTASVIE